MKSKEQIKIIVINRPTKEQAKIKTKELCEFLEKTWFVPINTKSK